jgi:uncharacterized Zn finger protein (UPF0148 family)
MTDDIIQHFLHCPKCALIWADNWGYEETACPRCGRQDKIDELEGRLEEAKSEMDEYQAQAEKYESKADELEGMLEDIHSRYDTFSRKRF